MGFNSGFKGLTLPTEAYMLHVLRNGTNQGTIHAASHIKCHLVRMQVSRTDRQFALSSDW